MRLEEKSGKFVVVDFNELEAYKIATKIEKDGIRFYENIANCTNNKVVKSNIEFLLEEERRHLQFFEECLSAARQKIDDGFEDDDLLDAMEFGIFQPFQSVQKMAQKIDDVKKAVRLGVAIEEKSILFYQACRDKVSSLQTKGELGKIIEQEKQHKVLFENILKVGAGDGDL